MGRFELLPHTADVALAAYGRSREECLRQAVLGLTSCFADTSTTTPTQTIDVNIWADDGADLLARVLEEVVYLADTRDLVVVQAAVEPAPGDTVSVHLGVAPLDTVDLVGPAPKGISRNGLRLEPAGREWQCWAIIDV